MSENPIVFNTEDSLWQMLKDRSKRWDARKWDIADERMYRLAQGHTARQPYTEPERFFPNEKWVSFKNNATNEVLTLEFRGIEFVPWAPGWAFLILGDVVHGDDDSCDLPW